MNNIENLITEGCSVLQVDKVALLSPTRKRPYIDVRHLLIYFAKEIIKVSEASESKGYWNRIKNSVVAEKFAKKKHNSVTHSVSQAKRLLETDKDFREKHDILRKHLIANGWESYEI